MGFPFDEFRLKRRRHVGMPVLVTLWVVAVTAVAMVAAFVIAARVFD